MRPEILLHSGRYLNLLEPSGKINIRDISHALSNICRFGGHVREFYSVAQHSVYVSRITESLEGLLHDAAEAFIGDVSSPLKQLLPEYKAIERRLEQFIFEQFGLTYPMPDVVKQADLIRLATEEDQLMPDHDDEWEIIKGVRILGVPIPLWTPWQADLNFMRRYEQLA